MLLREYYFYMFMSVFHGEWMYRVCLSILEHGRSLRSMDVHSVESGVV